MVVKRFEIQENNDYLVLYDNDKLLDLKEDFEDSNFSWLSVLVDFLNNQDDILRNVTFNYLNSVNELNEFKSKIIHHLQEEIHDCEILLEIDDNDIYAQGRLVELHNIMKVLL